MTDHVEPSPNERGVLMAAESARQLEAGLRNTCALRAAAEARQREPAVAGYHKRRAAALASPVRLVSQPLGGLLHQLRVALALINRTGPAGQG